LDRIKRLFVGGSLGNEHLTAVLAAVLLLLLAIEGATLLQIGSLLTVHAFVGMLLIPVLAVKVASTGWRFLRYYRRGEEYVQRGPPHLVLRALVAPFAGGDVGYVCGQLQFTDDEGDNQEGLYWRYEMAVRELESGLGGVTAGNGGIYAVRSDAYMPLPASASHDLSLPFELAKRGMRALYAPWAVAEERMVPTLEGEFARKRRMMVGLWDIVVREGMLSPRGYRPLFAFQIASHRLIRYLTPLLPLVALAANIALLGHGWVYAVTLAAQAAILLAALLGRFVPLAPLRMARYYVLSTASIAAGLWDRARRGSPGTWEKAAGTR